MVEIERFDFFIDVLLNFAPVIARPINNGTKSFLSLCSSPPPSFDLIFYFDRGNRDLERAAWKGGRVVPTIPFLLPTFWISGVGVVSAGNSDFHT